MTHNIKNIGIAISLNKGIKISRGEYIVRMDVDDIRLPQKIKKQVEFMDASHEIWSFSSFREANYPFTTTGYRET